MVNIILEDGKNYELNSSIESVIESIDRSLEDEMPFILIEIKGVKRLIRVAKIKEITEIEEISPSVSNFNITINIDTDEFIEKLTKAMMERLNYTKQGCRKPS